MMKFTNKDKVYGGKDGLEEVGTTYQEVTVKEDCDVFDVMDAFADFLETTGYSGESIQRGFEYAAGIEAK